MMRSLPMLLVLTVALAACNRQPSAVPAPAPATPPAATTAAAPAPADVPAGPARYDGYEALRFGMTADEVRQAWKGSLNGAQGKDSLCYYLNPVGAGAPDHFALMIEGDKFVRYDVSTDAIVAPGGGRLGMDADQVRKLYAGRIADMPSKYVKGGVDLHVKANDASGSLLIFEVGADGKVSAWRVGQPLQANYVEACG